MAEESNPFRISSVEGPHGKGIRLEFDVGHGRRLLDG